MKAITRDDPEIAELIQKEALRIENTLNLIAAENHAPQSVMDVLGSVFNTKTIEGYPGKRFHSGCIYADRVENLAVSRGKALFDAEYVNVQPHSGTSANLAVYFSVLEMGDRVLSMRLAHGGHLSHGHRASITSSCFDFSHYDVNLETGLIDYDEVEELARTLKPKMIVAGASSYPRLIDYERMARIAQNVSAFLLVDMAHLAGLVAARVIPSPVPFCDFVTFTCYKTMMGGRGGVILSRNKFGQKINSSIFPGCQGTSAVNLIAAKALIFKLAMEPDFISTQRRTLENAACLSEALKQKGFHIVTGGTDTHQVLFDVTSAGMDGKRAEAILESVGIISNRNVIPGDEKKPGSVTGIRLGSAGSTTRGMGKDEMIMIAELIWSSLTNADNQETLSRVSKEVLDLCGHFPVYQENPSQELS